MGTCRECKTEDPLLSGAHVACPRCTIKLMDAAKAQRASISGCASGKLLDDVTQFLDRIADCHADLHGWQIDAADLAKRLRETTLAASGYDDLLRQVQAHRVHCSGQVFDDSMVGRPCPICRP